MGLIDVLTVNEELESQVDLIRVVEEARNYFSTETWDDVRYIGKLKMNHDVTITTGKEHRRALLVENITKRIRRIRDCELTNLLLGITTDPVIAMYYYLDGNLFRRSLFLVHDYVSEKIGIVSLFRVKEESASKVIAHGLGHSRGLVHHHKPIDLMYSRLLNTLTLQVEGFCKGCKDKLEETQVNTLQTNHNKGT